VSDQPTTSSDIVGNAGKTAVARALAPHKANGPAELETRSFARDVLHPQPEHNMPRSTALQSIAQQIARLSYIDMMTFARSLHKTSDQVLAEHPVEISDLLYAWATAELEHGSSASTTS
jgi:hypothetical protein